VHTKKLVGATGPQSSSQTFGFVHVDVPIVKVNPHNDQTRLKTYQLNCWKARIPQTSVNLL